MVQSIKQINSQSLRNAVLEFAFQGQCLNYQLDYSRGPEGDSRQRVKVGVGVLHFHSTTTRFGDNPCSASK